MIPIGSIGQQGRSAQNVSIRLRILNEEFIMTEWSFRGTCISS
jgi:hypothetical protein